MNKDKSSKYKSKYKSKKEQLPQFGWGGVGQAIGTGLGALLAIPTGGMSLAAGAALGSALGGAGGSIIDSATGGENTQGNQIQMPQLNIDPVNTQGFYNPVKAYGGGIPNLNGIATGMTPAESIKDPKVYAAMYNKGVNNGYIKDEIFGKSIYATGVFNKQTPQDKAVFQTNQDNLKLQRARQMQANPLTRNPNYDLNGFPIQPNVAVNNIKAYGGQVNPNAEIEGNEVMQHNPNQPPMAVGQGNIQQIASDMSVAKGPTHANGGIPVAAQPGSMVVSDRLPAPNTKEYKSIANKVEMLGRKKGQLEKKIVANPNDKIAKDTIGLVQKQIDTLIQQQEQMKAQNSEAIMAKAYQKAFGGTVTGNERLDKDFLNMWNTGSYAYGGELPKFDGINNPSSYIPFRSDANQYNLYQMGIDPFKVQDGVPYKEQNQYTKPIPQTNQTIVTGIMNSDLNTYNQNTNNNKINYALPESYMPNYLNNNVSNINEDARVGYMPSKEVTQLNTNRSLIGKDGKPLEEFKVTGYEGQTNVNSLYPSKKVIDDNSGKAPLKENTFGDNLQYAAQYIPDIIASFTKKDKPIDPNMYMNQSRVNAARYDTSAEEAAVQDARSQTMLLAKESSGGDAGMYANMGNVANTGAYKNLGQVYNRAQNINMQNQMAADQANAGIEGQNRGMALNIANMNQADASAVEDRRMAGMQGIANKLANNYSQDRQFKLLKDIAPHYNYDESNGELTFKGKKYYGEEAKTLLEQLRMNTSNAYNKVLGFGQNLFTGGKE